MADAMKSDKGNTPARSFRLGEVASKQLSQLAEQMHDGNETATLRELIRKAHKAAKLPDPIPNEKQPTRVNQRQ